MSEQREAKAQKGNEKHGKSTLDHIEVHKAANGGHIVRHVLKHDPDRYGFARQEEKDHVFGPEQGREALMHIAEHAGIQHKLDNTDEEDDGEGADEYEES